MTIQIIDNSGVEEVLNFDYRNSEVKFSFQELKNYIKNCFTETINQLLPIINNTNALTVKINLEQQKSGKNYVTLASYDAYLSSMDVFVFYIYFDSLKELINVINKQLNYSEIDLQFKSTLLHECVHALDLKSIKKSDQFYENEYRLTKNKTDFFSNDADSSEKYLYDFQWRFLNCIEAFRNEGIATLGEDLFSHSHEKITIDEYHSRINEFGNYINSVCEICLSDNTPYQLKKENASEQLNNIKLASYSLGKYSLIKVIEIAFPEKEDTVNQLISFYTGKTELSNTEKIEILKFLFEIDMSEYINGILQIPFTDEDLTKNYYKNILECCCVIQNEKNDSGISLFTKHIFISAYNNSLEDYINLMKNTVGYAMETEEINQLYNEFLNKDDTEDIIKNIKQLCKPLLQQLNTQQCEVSRWALTYLLDDEDLIHDELSNLGYQDDAMVLNSALNFLKINSSTIAI